eukprot:scaffold2574_cov110-Isochrysis_galbana.AAC.3
MLWLMETWHRSWHRSVSCSAAEEKAPADLNFTFRSSRREPNPDIWRAACTTGERAGPGPYQVRWPLGACSLPSTKNPANCATVRPPAYFYLELPHDLSSCVLPGGCKMDAMHGWGGGRACVAASASK